MADAALAGRMPSDEAPAESQADARLARSRPIRQRSMVAWRFQDPSYTLLTCGDPGTGILIADRHDQAHDCRAGERMWFRAFGWPGTSPAAVPQNGQPGPGPILTCTLLGGLVPDKVVPLRTSGALRVHGARRVGSVVRVLHIPRKRSDPRRRLPPGSRRCCSVRAGGEAGSGWI